jgi:hypothetical protein
VEEQTQFGYQFTGLRVNPDAGLFQCDVADHDGRRFDANGNRCDDPGHGLIKLQSEVAYLFLDDGAISQNVALGKQPRDTEASGH